MREKFDLKVLEKKIEEEGLAWEMKGQLDKALQTYERLLKEAQAFSPTGQKEANRRNAIIAYLVLRKAGILLQTGKLEHCEHLMQDALNYAEQSDDLTAIGRAKLGLGVFYASSNRFEDGEKLLTEAVRAFSQGDDYDSKQGVGWALLNLGGLYGKQDKWIEAEKRLDQAIKLLKAIENWVGVATAFELKAKQNSVKGNLVQAKEDLLNAIAFYEKQGMKEKADSLRKSLEKKT